MASRLFLIGATLLTLSCSNVAIAGSLIVDHVADIEQVSVRVLAPRHEPLANMSARALEARVEQVISEVIQQYGLQLVDHAVKRGKRCCRPKVGEKATAGDNRMSALEFRQFDRKFLEKG